MKINIEPYRPEWKAAFDQERLLLLRAIREPGTRVEHIGSTSVVGLAAKPIIDIMIGLTDFEQADRHIPAMETAGYTYMAKYEDVMPYRRFFVRESGGIRTHHVHMVGQDSVFWERHLRFRDHLRENPEDRNRYIALKRHLATREWKDMNEYAEAKSAFIREIEEKTNPPRVP